MTPSVPPILGPVQAGAILKVAPDTVSLFADQGQLPAIRSTGGFRRFWLSDVLHFAQHRPRPLTSGEQTGGALALEQRIAELIAQAPPLSDEQRGRLAAILAGHR